MHSRREGPSPIAASDFMPPEPIDIRRKRLIHRSLYTGMKETDLLLGAFARAHVASFDADQLERYERLLGEPDPAIFAWAIGREPAPPEHDDDVMALLRRFAQALRP